VEGGGGDTLIHNAALSSKQPALTSFNLFTPHKLEQTQASRVFFCVRIGMLLFSDIYLYLYTNCFNTVYEYDMSWI